MATNPQNASVAAINLGNRLDLLHQNGHSWMAPDLQVHLANSPISNNTMLNNAAIYRSVADQTGKALTNFFSDAIHNKIPAAWDSVYSTLHHVYGPVPGVTDDVTQIQKGLQKKGYGTDLPVGTWNPQWQSAFTQHTQDSYNKPGTGNVKSLPFWKSVLGELSPSKWTSDIAHYVATLPAQGRQLLADVAGAAGTTLTDITDPSHHIERQAKIEASVENALGGNLTANDIKKEGVARDAQDLGNIFNLLLLKGVGGAAYKAVGQLGADVAASVGTKATATDYAKAIFTRSLADSAAGTPRFTVVKSLYSAGVEGQKGTGLLRVFENTPVLKRMLPAIDAMDAQGSLYYTFKNELASFAKMPLRQFGAIAQTKGMQAGLGLLGATAAEKAIGMPVSYDATKAQAYEGPLASAADLASMFVGVPTKGINPSKNVGQVVDAAHSKLSDAMGTIGIDQAIKSGLGISVKELQKNLGEGFVNDHFVNTKLNQYAASHYADLALREKVYAKELDFNSDEAKKFFMEKEHEALNDPEILGSARDSLILQPDVLASMYRKDFSNILGANVRKGVRGYSDKDKQNFFDAMNNLKATHEPLATMLQPDTRNLFHGSATMVAIQDMITKGLSEEWAKKAPAFDDTLSMAGKPGPTYYHLNTNVNEFAPDSNRLVSSTRYGKGVVTTTNPGIAGRADANVYAMRHTPVGGELPKFYSMIQKGNSTPISQQIVKLLGGTIDAPAGSFASKTVRQYRDELGLVEPGKTEGSLVSIPKENYPEAYKKLRSMLKNDLDYSGQQILDQYRVALTDAGKLNKEQIDERIHNISASMLQDNQYTGFHYYDNKYGVQTVINPDRAYATMVAQDPKWTKDSLLPGYLQSNNIVQRGALGIARHDTFIAQDAQRMANKLFDKLAQYHSFDVQSARSALDIEERQGLTGQKLPSLTGAIGKVEANILEQARGILIKKLGYAPNEVTRLDPIQAISQIWRDSRTLASEAFLPPNAPKHLQDAVAKLNELGYRPVLGTDIGHSYEAPILHPIILENHTKMVRRAAQAMGIDISKISDISVARVRRTNVENEINKLIATEKITPVLGDNGSSVYSLLMQAARSGEFASEGRLATFFRGGAQELRDKRFIKAQLGDTTGMTTEEIQLAKDDIRKKTEDVFNQSHTIRDLSLKQMVKALTRPVDAKDVLGDMSPRYSKEDAMKIAKAVLVGYAKTPASLVGLGKVEDFIRASNAMLTHSTASFFGKVPVAKNFKIGEGPLAFAFASLPNDLARMRDKWRFDLNPVFAFRRLAKTNVKAAVEGVPPSRNPWASLESKGVREEAFNILERTMPDVYKNAKELESLDKFLIQSDVFGVFNPAHNMAWQAWNLKQLGLTDAEITEKLVKINTYGDRTPLERTINTIFYPFSFNKTLYRSVGGYILDHPGEAMLINAGFNLYSHYDPNNEFGKWVDRHAPLLKELQKLNAFEHGTGLGQFGGINAPYFNEIMNLFSPQRILPQDQSAAIRQWKLAIPALSELNSLLFNYNATTGKADFKGSLVEAGKVGFWTGQNLAQHTMDWLSGNKRMNYQTTLTDDAQVQAGIETVNALKIQLAPIMNDPGHVWPSSPDVPKVLWGKQFNATTFGEYARSLYPAYDPTIGLTIALKKSQQAKDYVASLKGTFRYDSYAYFQKYANSAVTKLRKTSDPESIQSISDPLRKLAVNIAEQDPKFVAFYKRYYASVLGPIEGLSK